MGPDTDHKEQVCTLLSEVFEVAFTVGEFRTMVTPGHTTRILVERIRAAGHGPRLGDRAVAAVRDRLGELGCAPDAAEETELARILARPYAEPWARLGRSCGVSMPPLTTPKWIWWVAFLSWILFVVGLIIARIRLDLPIWAFLTALAVSGIPALLIPPFIRREIPERCRTVDDLAAHLLFANHEMLNDDDPSWSEEQVAEVVELVAKRTYGLETVEPDTPLPG